MKLKKLLLTLLIMMFSTGVLFACTADDQDDPATNDDTNEQQDSDDTETDSDTEEDQE